MARGVRLSPRMATAAEVLSAYEVETFLLYCAEDVVHRIVGATAFRGEGEGVDTLRATMVQTLRRFVSGFRGGAVGVHPAPGFLVVEWEGVGVKTTGRSVVHEGLFLVQHEADRVQRVLGYVVPREPQPSAEEGEG